MRVCPRRHYHTEVSHKLDASKDAWSNEYWCIDCGAKRHTLSNRVTNAPYQDSGWRYPAITELVRGRDSDRLVERGVYTRKRIERKARR